MKSLIALTLLICSCHVLAVQVSIDTRDIGSPTYMRNSRLIIDLSSINSPDNNHSIDIHYNSQDKSLGSQSLKISKARLNECETNYICDLFHPLKTGLDHLTCELKITLLDASANIVSKKTLNWGKCNNGPFGREDDLTVDQVNIALENVLHELPEDMRPHKKIILNSLQDKFEYVLIGRDFNANIIYSDRKYKNSISHFLNISPRKLKELCSLELIIDPFANINDPNLENNSKSFSVGECATAPVDKRVDLELAYKDGLLYLFNSNDQIVLAENVQVNFDVFDQNGNRSLEFSKSLEGQLGYQEFSTFNYSHLLLGNNCRLHAYVNPKGSILEEDFNNNELIIDNCN